MLSIIVPIYQVEKYLRKGLESLLDAPNGELEILLVDDGSTDGSGQICDEYGARYSNIQVCHQTNRGVSHARNTGIKMAQGEYITFFDPDDYVEKDYYVKMLHHLEQSDADIVFSGYQREYANGRCEPREEQGFRDIEYNEVPQKLFLPSAYKRGTRQVPLLGSVCRAVFRHSIVKNANIWFHEDIGFSEDLLFLLDYLNYANKYCYLPGYGYHYCVREASATAYGYKEGLIENEKKFLRELERIISESKRMKQSEKNSLMARCHYYYARWVISNEIRMENHSDFASTKQNRKEFAKFFLNSEAIKQMILDMAGVKTIVIVLLARFEMYSLIRWLYKVRFGEKDKKNESIQNKE